MNNHLQANTRKLVAAHQHCDASSQFGPFQSSLVVNTSAGALEREAEDAADAFVRAGDKGLRSNKPSLSHADGTMVDPHGTEAPQDIHDVIRTVGEPLDAKARGIIESSFEHDFSAVRVHSNPAASVSARSINAKAYTVKNDIVFGAGYYKPRSVDGQHLLAHELAHVVQQRSMAGRGAGATMVIQRSEVDDAQVVEPASSDYWKILRLELVLWLTGWADEQDEAADRFEKNLKSGEESDGVVKVPTIVKEILRLIPGGGKYAVMAVGVVESLFNGFNKLSTPEISVEDFFEEYYQSRMGFRAAVRQGQLDIFAEISEQRDLENTTNSAALRQQIDNSIDLFKSTLPTAEQIREIMLLQWIQGAEDVSDWFEPDFKKGQQAGYIYMRVFKNIQAFGNVNWIMIEGPFVDDVARPNGTNEALKQVYKNAHIDELPLEIQISIETSSPPGTRVADPQTVRAIKYAQPALGLDYTQKWAVTFGHKTLLDEWRATAPKPTVSDLKIDD